MNTTNKCSKCGNLLLFTDTIQGHETATWHAVCPVTGEAETQEQPDPIEMLYIESPSISLGEFRNRIHLAVLDARIETANRAWNSPRTEMLEYITELENQRKDLKERV